jgi:hypothetical protein
MLCFKHIQQYFTTVDRAFYIYSFSWAQKRQDAFFFPGKEVMQAL